MSTVVNEGPAMPIVRVPVIDATRENMRDYGLFIGTEVLSSGLAIPFYKGSVVEGNVLPFVCKPPPVVRTAQIRKRSNEVRWLERHLGVTQLFVGLGSATFVMVLGKPTHARGMDVPDLDDVRAFKLPAGHGVLIHQGTWHDFPMAWSDPVTVLTVSSLEIVNALASVKDAHEMNEGDVLKIDIARSLGKQLVTEIP